MVLSYGPEGATIAGATFRRRGQSSGQLAVGTRARYSCATEAAREGSYLGGTIG